MGTNIHALAHRLTALSMACLASTGFIFCILSGFGCSFVQIQALEGKIIGTASGGEFENLETAYLGVRCLSGIDAAFYPSGSSSDSNSNSNSNSSNNNNNYDCKTQLQSNDSFSSSSSSLSSASTNRSFSSSSSLQQQCRSQQNCSHSRQHQTQQQQTQTQQPRNVRFAPSNGVRTYSLVLGDHPLCDDGLSIDLGWDYNENEQTENNCNYGCNSGNYYCDNSNRNHHDYNYNCNSGNGTATPTATTRCQKRSYLSRKQLLLDVAGCTKEELDQRLSAWSSGARTH
mmetsp:Transcript_1420/g.2869  ORF Transcript_1420/g.2869 Transcript_1420/m.2869 type:complete len:286 (-) Transcript_1420:281-1138(-)